MSDRTSTTTPYSPAEATSARESAAARSILYGFLSLGFLYPQPGCLEQMREESGAGATGLEFLRCTEGIVAMGEVRNALADLTVPTLEAEHSRVFGHTAMKECPLYETECESPHVFQKAQALADIGGFYNAFGLAQTGDVRERPDHLSVELEFMHFLTLKEAHALEQGHEEGLRVCRQAQEKFLGSHLARWIPLFCQRLSHRAGDGFYGSLGALLGGFLHREVDSLNIVVEEEVQELAMTPEEQDLPCPYLDEEGGEEPCR